MINQANTDISKFGYSYDSEGVLRFNQTSYIDTLTEFITNNFIRHGERYLVCIYRKGLNECSFTDNPLKAIEELLFFEILKGEPECIHLGKTADMKANFFKMYISGCPEGALAMIVHLTKPEYEYLMQNKHMTGAFLKRYKQMITD